MTFSPFRAIVWLSELTIVHKCDQKKVICNLNNRRQYEPIGSTEKQSKWMKATTCNGRKVGFQHSFQDKIKSSLGPNLLFYLNPKLGIKENIWNIEEARIKNEKWSLDSLSSQFIQKSFNWRPYNCVVALQIASIDL